MINIKYLLTAMSITLLVVSCQNGLSEADKGEYLERGKKIAAATAENMLAEVGKNMKEGGVAQAVPFCNIHADGLTTEMAQQNGASIKRNSHLLRNEKNAPTTREQEIIAQFQKLQAEKQELFRKYGIGVTDIFLKIRRKNNSNLDTNLEIIEYNDKNLVSIIENPQIKTIFFTSKFVETHFYKLFPKTKKGEYLPSPSPRYAIMSISDKINYYKSKLPR